MKMISSNNNIKIKRAYVSPKLQKHGSVRKFTQKAGSATDAPFSTYTP